MIRNILLDLDDTILDFKVAEREALTKTLLHFNISPEEKILTRYSEINKQQWKLLEQGKITRDDVKIKRYEILFGEMKITQCSPREATKYYEEQLGKGHFFIKGAEEVLKNLSVNYRIYIVTNGSTKVQTGRIKSSGIEKYIDGVFNSEKVGCEKPGRKFFENCFSHIPNFKHDETIIVGDSLSSDIQGGINSGIKTVWFNAEKNENKTDIIPDYEISKLWDLLEVLKNIL